MNLQKSPPWETEPDYEVFEASGYRCTIIRHPRIGHLCGYVEVPPEHPAVGTSWDNTNGLEVHGGVTYGQSNPFGYVIGFDCAHAGDFCPKEANSPLGETFIEAGYVYRDWAYVKEQTEKLAAQLRLMETSDAP